MSDNTASSGEMISDQWIGKDVEGSGRGLILDTIQSFAWEMWETTKYLG
jgi:hypothetical protein